MSAYGSGTGPEYLDEPWPRVLIADTHEHRCQTCGEPFACQDDDCWVDDARATCEPCYTTLAD